MNFFWSALNMYKSLGPAVISNEPDTRIMLLLLAPEGKRCKQEYGYDKDPYAFNFHFLKINVFSAVYSSGRNEQQQRETKEIGNIHQLNPVAGVQYIQVNEFIRTHIAYP